MQIRQSLYSNQKGDSMQIEEKLEVFRNFTIDVAKQKSDEMIAQFEHSCKQELETFRQNKQTEMEHKIQMFLQVCFCASADFNYISIHKLTLYVSPKWSDFSYFEGRQCG